MIEHTCVSLIMREIARTKFGLFSVIVFGKQHIYGLEHVPQTGVISPPNLRAGTYKIVQINQRDDGSSWVLLNTHCDTTPTIASNHAPIMHDDNIGVGADIGCVHGMWGLVKTKDGRDTFGDWINKAEKISITIVRNDKLNI